MPSMGLQDLVLALLGVDLYLAGSLLGQVAILPFWNGNACLAIACWKYVIYF